MRHGQALERGLNTSSHTRRSAVPFKRHLPVLLFTAAGGAALLLVSLMLISLSSVGRNVAAQGASALVIRAVLRADVDPVGAEELAQRVRQQVPNVELEIITETMGRALMALQEPWIARMPDFEVTPLPVLLEVQHPKLLTDVAQVQQFVRFLNAQDEVDFVAYNETAHNRLVGLAGTIDNLRRHALGWMLTLIGIAGFVLALVGFRQVDHDAWFYATAAAVTWLVALGIAWPAYRVWERSLLREQDFSAISTGTIMQAGGVALLIVLAGSLCARALPGWRR